MSLTDFLPVAGVAAVLIGAPVLAVGTRNALRSRGARPLAMALSLGLILAGALAFLATAASRSPVAWLVGVGAWALGGFASPLMLRLSGGPDPVFATRRDAARFFALLNQSTDNPDRLPSAFAAAKELDRWRVPATLPLIEAVQAVAAELAEHGRARDEVLVRLYERVAHESDQIKRTYPRSHP